MYPFCEELLATVCSNSPDHWWQLRSTCTAASSWLQHHDYEGAIKRDDVLSAVVGLNFDVGLIPVRGSIALMLGHLNAETCDQDAEEP